MRLFCHSIIIPYPANLVNHKISAAQKNTVDLSANPAHIQKYKHIAELTPKIMNGLIEKIVIHVLDKSSGHRTQEIEIHFRFNVAVTTAVAGRMKYGKKRERLRKLIGYAV